MHESNKVHGPACWVCVYIARSSGLGLEMKRIGFVITVQQILDIL